MRLGRGKRSIKVTLNEQVALDHECHPLLTEDDGANLAHRFADGVKEGPTGVLHQMPAVGD